MLRSFSESELRNRRLQMAIDVKRLSLVCRNQRDKERFRVEDANSA